MHERDNCGVGLVADLNKKPSRVILTDCNEMLVRMSHRGGCGCDPQSGDGAGMLVAMPDAFMRKHSGFELPAQGDYAVAMCFLPQEEANADRARKSLERASRQRVSVCWAGACWRRTIVIWAKPASFRTARRTALPHEEAGLGFAEVRTGAL